MLKVYIAGPITKGMWDENIGRGIEAYNKLVDENFAPYLPHLNFFPALSKRRPFDVWIKQDFTFLPCCDVLLRLSGESKGADMECAEAQRLNIPVFNDIESIIKHRDCL